MKLALTCVSVLAMAACATGIPTSQLAAYHHVQLARATAKTSLAFPARQSAPDLPTAEARHLGWRDGTTLSTKLELCVGPGGDTVEVALRKSSGDAAFDDAVIHDAAKWRYQPFAAPDAARVCEPATVNYVP